MNRLRTRFWLALNSVLLAATLLPILVLYLLTVTGLVEATYVTEGNENTQPSLPVEPAPGLPVERIIPPRLPSTGERLWEDGPLVFSQADPLTGGRTPVITYDAATGQWKANIPSELQRLVFTSPVFKLRIDLPAWLVLGSLPLAGLLLGTLLSLTLSRSVTRPVTQLVEATRAIGRRELGYRVQTRGSQELQDLAQSFNRMAAALEHADAHRRNLMADVAHELRTPLTVLEGNLRAMLDGVHELNEAEIALLYEQTHHLNRLVEDLRDISLAEADQLTLHPQPIDLTRLVQETVAHFAPLAQEQDIQLTMDLDESIPPQRMDENRIRQILHNLFSNAFHHTARGGQVRIAVKRSPEPSKVEITVQDTGSGIAPEELPFIFNRFYQVGEAGSPVQQGSGLGLAIVKALVEAHGGQVSAHSAGKDQGSTFTVRFSQ